MFLAGVPVDHVSARLALAGGNEITSGKFDSPQSSASLAVNTFGWFIERPSLLPPIDAATTGTPILSVEVEYCARFPWTDGQHPWLDAAITTEHNLIGVESKRYEPYRDTKSVRISAAYDRDVWGNAMTPFIRVKDLLRSGELAFRFLDATQLIKHAFGLVTDGRRRGLSARLVYLFAEPRSVSESVLARHRAEVGRFAGLVEGAEVGFSSLSYREWIARWESAEPDVAAHGRTVLATFEP